jgi:hypothetical protein
VAEEVAKKHNIYRIHLDLYLWRNLGIEYLEN